MDDRRIIILLAGVIGILLAGSLASFVLSRRAHSEAMQTTVRNLESRVKAWWVMVAIFAAAFLLGPTVTLILFALTSFYCLREMITLTPTRPADHRAVATAFYVFIPLQYWLIFDEWQTVFAIAIPVYAFLLLPVLTVLAGETDHFLERTAKLQWGLMLTVYCISHAPALLILDIPGHEGENFLWLFFLIAVVQLSDVLQYVFGKLFGRHKVAPRISPAKTWEGLIGGGLSAALVGGGLSWITPLRVRSRVKP